MKKIVSILLCLCCMVLSVSAMGPEESVNGRYIMRTDKNALVLLSDMPEGVMSIGNDLYVAKSYESMQEFTENMPVVSVVPDCELELLEDTYPTSTSDPNIGNQWYLNTLGVASAREKGIDGRGVVVAVIDSGVNRNHPDMANANILPGVNAMLDDGVDLYDDNDVYGHGTQVSGIIAADTNNEVAVAGIAPGVSILPIKITNSKSLYLTDFLNGIGYALGMECDIVNMSLGGAISGEALEELKYYINMMEEQGKIAVSAVGNDGSTTVFYPAGISTVVGVGAIDPTLSVASLSHRNSSVFVTAPGTSIKVLYGSSGTATGSGTSFSTPMVAAAAAIVKQLDPDCTPEEFRMLLQNTVVDDETTPGYDTGYGHGILSISNIITALSDRIPDVLLTEGSYDGERKVYVHNNTEGTLTADGYFVTYLQDEIGKSLDTVNIRNLSLASGVTPLATGTFTHMFLWDSNFCPLAKSCIIK